MGHRSVVPPLPEGNETMKQAGACLSLRPETVIPGGGEGEANRDTSKTLCNHCTQLLKDYIHGENMRAMLSGGETAPTVITTLKANTRSGTQGRPDGRSRRRRVWVGLRSTDSNCRPTLKSPEMSRKRPDF